MSTCSCVLWLVFSVSNLEPHSCEHYSNLPYVYLWRESCALKGAPFIGAGNMLIYKVLGGKTLGMKQVKAVASKAKIEAK